MAREKRMNAGFGFLKDPLCPSDISPEGENQIEKVMKFDWRFWGLANYDLRGTIWTWILKLGF